MPQRPVVFVTRKKLVNAIRQNLFKLSDEPGWVVIYGMAGCGKSVLAAEAVRDHFFLDGCFPGGVHWVSVGKQDKAGLLMKLQNLCTRLDQDENFSQRPPLNIEEAKDRLRLLMLRKHSSFGIHKTNQKLAQRFFIIRNKQTDLWMEKKPY